VRPVPEGGGEGAAERVLGVGVDLVEIDRVAAALTRWGRRIVDRLMAGPESARLPADGPERTQAFAEAIAVKEAASKSLGTGWTRGVAWRHVELVRGPSPRALLHEGAARRAGALGARGARVVELTVREGLVIAEVWLLA
jgi:holo-[acyl-carrier protein] synthase